MTRSPSLCGIILAAGDSTRMGRDKALLPWPPVANDPFTPLLETFLGAHIAALRPHCDMVLVVGGKNSESLEPVVYTQAAFLLTNSAPELGQFSSLKIALQEVLNRGRDSAIVSLVDRPPVKMATLARLHDAFLESVEKDGWGVVPQFEGKHGHPYFASRELIEVLLRAPLTSTARDVMHGYESRLDFLEIEDPYITLNINTPEDYAALVGECAR